MGQNDGVSTPSPYAPEPADAPPAAAQPALTYGIDRTAIILSASIAVVLLISAVVTFSSLQNFPSNAPVEQLYAFGITVDLVAGALALGARLLFVARVPRATHAVPGPGGLAITSAALGLLVLVGWLLLGGADFLAKLAGSGEGLRYYLDVTGEFFLGIPWILGIFFGVAGYRTGRGPVNAALAFGGLGLGLLLVLASLYSAVVYGLGLSN